MPISPKDTNTLNKHIRNIRRITLIVIYEDNTHIREYDHKRVQCYYIRGDY